jgi:hypothetical protein
MSKPHVEYPDFDRMAEAREVLKEMREDQKELKHLRNINTDMLEAGRNLLELESRAHGREEWMAARDALRAAIAKVDGRS